MQSLFRNNLTAYVENVDEHLVSVNYAMPINVFALLDKKRTLKITYLYFISKTSCKVNKITL